MLQLERRTWRTKEWILVSWVLVRWTMINQSRSTPKCRAPRKNYRVSGHILLPPPIASEPEVAGRFHGWEQRSGLDCSIVERLVSMVQTGSGAASGPLAYVPPWIGLWWADWSYLRASYRTLVTQFSFNMKVAWWDKYMVIIPLFQGNITLFCIKTFCYYFSCNIYLEIPFSIPYTVITKHTFGSSQILLVWLQRNYNNYNVQLIAFNPTTNELNSNNYAHYQNLSADIFWDIV